MSLHEAARRVSGNLSPAAGGGTTASTEGQFSPRQRQALGDVVDAIDQTRRAMTLYTLSPSQVIRKLLTVTQYVDLVCTSTDEDTQSSLRHNLQVRYRGTMGVGVGGEKEKETEKRRRRGEEEKRRGERVYISAIN